MLAPRSQLVQVLPNYKFCKDEKIFQGLCTFAPTHISVIPPDTMLLEDWFAMKRQEDNHCILAQRILCIITWGNWNKNRQVMWSWSFNNLVPSNRCPSFLCICLNCWTTFENKPATRSRCSVHRFSSPFSCVHFIWFFANWTSVSPATKRSNQVEWKECIESDKESVLRNISL